MKHPYGIVLLLLLFTSTFAQTNDPLSAKLNSVFANIEASQVPTGFLKEYGLPLVPLGIFNGVLSDSNKVDVSVWRMAYATLLTSRIYSNNPLSDLNAVNSTIATDENANPGLFVVPMLYADYNYLRPDAITANLMSVSNNQLYDVSGRTQSPYYYDRVFAASPTVGYAATGMPSFIFTPDIFYNASSRTLNYINVDFGDGGGYQNAMWNTPIAANYADTGTYQIKIKIIFADNSYMECYTPFQISQLNQQEFRAQQATSCLPYQYFDPVPGIHSGGTAWIEYNSANYASCQITKPLIVAKGYDLSDAGKSLGDHYTFQRFFQDLIFQPGSYNLYGNLDNAGYDIIFLDYNTSMDDITRNAALLEDVINWVNTQKAAASSAEQNVVLGISMGGLVARYCLANMTKQGLDPQTRLLLTDDSPHQGANMPLGLQWLIRAFNETTLARVGTAVTYGLSLYQMIPAYAQAVNALDETSSQQMLILHATDGHGGYSMNTFLNSTYRNMITFSPTDPPPAYRIEAMSLGSECGVNLLSPGSQLLQVSGNFFLSPIPWISKHALNTYGLAKALPVYGPSQNIMQLHIWSSYTILSVITINEDLTNKSANSPANTFPWDGVPGGVLKVKDQFSKYIPSSHMPAPNSLWAPFFNWTQGVTGADAFCFVPAVSALDVTTINDAALSAPYVGGVSPTDPVRVANFIADGKYDDPSGNLYNGTHAILTPRNAEWLFDEAQGITNNKNCSSDCTTNYTGLLNGPSLICTTGTFTITNQPGGTNVSWTSSSPSGLSINSTTGVATQMNNYNGQISISATITGSCGPVPVPPVNVWVGSPLLGLALDGHALPSDNFLHVDTGQHTLSIFNYGSSNVSMDVSRVIDGNFPGTVIYSQNMGNGEEIDYGWVIVHAGETYIFTVSNSSACGNQSIGAEITTDDNISDIIITYPNPASSAMTLQVSESLPTNSSTLNQPYQINVMNRFSQTVYSAQSSEKNFHIPLEGLPDDIYYLNVHYKGAVVQKQIVIKK